MDEKFCIIDIGSNSMRLVIYENGKNGRLKEIENVKVVARLRNYLNKENLLTNEGQKELINTLLTFQEITRYHSIKNSKCVATAAIRQANNSNEIIELVEQKTDFKMRILSGFEEAYYGFLGVVNSTPITEAVTIDIGGGSTEITYYKNRELIHFHSFPFGVLSLKQQFMKENVATEEEIKKLTLFLKTQLQTLPWLKNKQAPIIAIGGSARNLVQIHHALTSYPISGIHQYEMRLEDIIMVKKYITSLPFEQIQKIEGLSKDRADIIFPALQVFEILYMIVDSTSFMLSKKGLRDGIFYEEMMQNGEKLFPNIIENSISTIQSDFKIEKKQVYHVISLINQFVEQLQEKKITHLDVTDRNDLCLAASVYNIGRLIDEESSSLHTFYILANRTIDGIRHRDRVKLALIASFKNKNVFKQNIKPFTKWFNSDEQKKLRLLGIILKFIYCLNTTKREVIQKIHIGFESENKLTINLESLWNAPAEANEVEKNTKALEKALKKEISINFITN